MEMVATKSAATGTARSTFNGDLLANILAIAVT